MDSAGRQLLLEFSGCDSSLLNDEQALCELLTKAVTEAGYGLKGVHSHQYEPIGITAIAIISESHICIHTYPEVGHASVDIFTCSTFPEKSARLFEILKEGLGPERSKQTEIRRGDTLEVLREESVQLRKQAEEKPKETPLAKPRPSFRLEATVFIAGASVMALEMTGSRVLAPFLGSSLYVWTSLIGVVLASLSLGYILGGRIADARPELKLYSLLLFGAAGLVAIIPLLHYPLLGLLSSLQLDIRFGALIAAVLLFTLPAIFLGTISPFAARLRIIELEHSGSTVGRLWAISTIGSIFGTFLAGFVLISYFGTNQILLLIALSLLLASLLVAPREKSGFKLLLCLAVLGLFQVDAQAREALRKSGLLDLDTPYYRVFVLSHKEKTSGREMKTLVTDPLGGQSVMYLDDPHGLAGEYNQYYRLALHLRPQIRKVLVIGGGAYTLPKYLLAKHPQIQVDVVEIDPGMTRIAREHFDLKESPALSIFHQDARNFIRNSPGSTYDAVFVDAFSSSPSVPFHLTTNEFFAALERTLKPNGLMIMNIISGLEGEEGRFARALLKTTESVFSEVKLFAVFNPELLRRAQNLMFVASSSQLNFPDSDPNTELDDLLHHVVEKDIPRDIPQLTDSYAPVEYLILPSFVEWQRRK